MSEEEVSESVEPIYQPIGRVTNRTTNTDRTSSIFEKPTYVAILPIIFLFFFAIFGIAPLSEQVLIDAVCDEMDNDDCDSTEVSARAASLNFIAGLALNIPAVFLCGFFGALANKYGRKLVIYITLTGFLLYLCIVFYVTTYKPAIYAILVIGANFIFGLSGGYITFVMGALCYVSDSTIVIPHTRHTAYSVTEATIFAPQVMAPVLSGMWAAVYGYSLPYFVALITCVINIIYLSFLPESLPMDAECRSKPLVLDIWQTFRNLSYLFNYKSVEGTSPLPHVAGAFFLYFSAAMGFVATRIVYFKHEFHFDSGQIGIYGGVEGLVACLSMLFAPAAYTAVVGRPLGTIRWIQVGYFFRAVHWTLFSMMRTGGGVFALLPILLLVGPIAPYSCPTASRWRNRPKYFLPFLQLKC